MSNTELLAFVQAEIQRLRGLDGPRAVRRRSQLERAVRVLLNHRRQIPRRNSTPGLSATRNGSRPKPLIRGWAEAPVAQASREIAHGVHLHN